jgi:hypothetical protein
VTPSNTPSNCLDSLRTPIRTPIRTGIRSCSNTPSSILRTYPPNPPGSSKGLARLQVPPLPLAFGHGCASAALVSKRSAHRQDDRHDGLQEDGIDLLIGMSELIFNGEPRPITLESVPRLAAGVVQRVFVLARHQSPLNSRTNPWPSYGLCGRSAFPGASQPFIASDQTPHNPLQHSETRRRRHLFDDHRKGIFARANLRASASSLRPVRAAVRAPALCLPSQATIDATDGEAKRRGQINLTAPKRDRCGWGVAGTSDAGANIDLSIRYSAALFRILGGLDPKKLAAFPEKVGLPVKVPALTPVAVQDSLNGPVRWWGSAGSQNASAGPWRGMAT